MDILIGTRNKFKISEMLWYLDGIPNLTIHFLEELEKRVNVEEDGKTLEENAQKKALALSKLTDWAVFTSDAGVDIPGLGEKWDKRKPQRMVGEHKTDREKVETLIKLMEGLKGERRICQYLIALALARQGKLLWSDSAVCDQGVILENPSLEGIGESMWMSRVWFYPERNKTYEQLNPEEKAQVRALQLDLRNNFQEVVSFLANPNKG